MTTGRIRPFFCAPLAGRRCEGNGEYGQEQGARNERGHGDEGSGDDHDDLIDDLVAPQRRDRAEHDAHDERAEGGDKAELGRDLHAVGDDVDDLTAALLERGAKVKAQDDITEIGKILLQDRFVKSVFGLHGGLHRRSRRLFADERAARDGVHDEEGDRDNDPDRQNRQTDSFENVKQRLGIHHSSHFQRLETVACRKTSAFPVFAGVLL